MKNQPMLQPPDAAQSAAVPAGLSAEAALYREIAELRAWLGAQGIDLSDHTHADEGSRDRLYLRYGYFMGLKRALSVLTNCGATLH